MYRMLIADDEMIERAVLYKMLNKNLEGQCEIYQAENGRQALELYEKEKIQIAVLYRDAGDQRDPGSREDQGKR